MMVGSPPTIRVELSLPLTPNPIYWFTLEGGGGQGVSITLNTYVSNLQVLLLRKLQCSNKHVHLYSIDHFFDVIKHPTVYKNNLLWVGGETAAELEHDVGLFSVHSPFQP